jgi:hypothetical protein
MYFGFSTGRRGLQITFFLNAMSHLLTFTFAALFLAAWLLFAGLITGSLQYFLWALLVLFIFLRALTRQR